MNPVTEDPDREYLEFARAAFEHRECRAEAERLLGGDVTVAPDQGTENAVCPHGVRYWLVRTGEES